MKSICDKATSHYYMNWDNKIIVAANGLFKMYHSFSFTVSLVVTTNAMSIIKPICVKFPVYDIVKAYNKVEEIVKELCTVGRDETKLTLLLCPG